MKPDFSDEFRRWLENYQQVFLRGIDIQGLVGFVALALKHPDVGQFTHATPYMRDLISQLCQYMLDNMTPEDKEQWQDAIAEWRSVLGELSIDGPISN
jgi:hypothetical protein